MDSNPDVTSQFLLQFVTVVQSGSK